MRPATIRSLFKQLIYLNCVSMQLLEKAGFVRASRNPKVPSEALNKALVRCAVCLRTSPCSPGEATNLCAALLRSLAYYFATVFDRRSTAAA